MARPRKEGREGLPVNLNVQVRGGREYFYYRSPVTKRSLAIGYDRDKAIKYATEANASVAEKQEVRKYARLAVKHGHLDERGLLEGSTIARKAMLFDHVCAVYFLLQGEQIVYVGQSKSAMTRIATHWQERTKKFNRVFFVQCKEYELEHLEALYINKFQPLYNVTKPWVDPTSTAWDGTLSEVFGDAVYSRT